MAKKKEVLTLAGLKKEIDRLTRKINKKTKEFIAQRDTDSGIHRFANTQLNKEIDKLRDEINERFIGVKSDIENIGSVDFLIKGHNENAGKIDDLQRLADILRNSYNSCHKLSSEAHNQLSERVSKLEEKDNKIVRELSRINGDISKLTAKQDPGWGRPYVAGEQIEQAKQEALIKKKYQEEYEEYVKTFPASGVGIERIDNVLYVNKTFLDRNEWIEFDVPAGVDTFIIKVVE